MPLANIKIKSGINKTDTPSGAEGQWIDSDFVRFRYGQPEKIGGWKAIGAGSLAGPVRDIHTWTDLEGKNYAALGTSKCLYIYYEDAFYDITPLQTDITGAKFESTNGSRTVTVHLAGHGLSVGEFFLISNVTLPSGGETGYNSLDFTEFGFEVLSTPDLDTFTIQMNTNESGTGMNGGSSGGDATITPFVEIGPAIQIYGYGWGTEDWGSISTSTLTLNGAISATDTTITISNAAGLPNSGKIIIFGPTAQTRYTQAETIEYESKNGNDLTVKSFGGVATFGRGSDSSTARSHADGASVADAGNLVGWGDESRTSNVILDPGNWSLDNFGNILVATVKDGKTYTWDPSAILPLKQRAQEMNNAPTGSRMTIVSQRDRHLVHLGTETTIGNNTTQDNMFIRFSDQEDFNTYAPNSVNTAGTFRLDTGSKIVAAVSGKDYNLILTDQAAYTMQFVGPPFTFSIRQVGSNCGCIGQHAAVYADGEVFWMGIAGGFFKFDGTVKLLPSLVEDFVFSTTGPNIGINYSSNEIIYASHNSLFNEIVWFYPAGKPLADPSVQNDRAVVYNYVENIWSTMTLARSTFADSTTFPNPYGTEFTVNGLPTSPLINGATNSVGASFLYAHEIGTNEVDLFGNKTPIKAFVQSGDFDIPAEGDGEYLMHMRRFIPDFKNLVGKAKVTIGLKKFPIETSTSSPLGPFEIDNNTLKVDTRARGRLANIKVENENVDENWRFGTFRADVNIDGRR